MSCCSVSSSPTSSTSSDRKPKRRKEKKSKKRKDKEKSRHSQKESDADAGGPVQLSKVKLGHVCLLVSKIHAASPHGLDTVGHCDILSSAALARGQYQIQRHHRIKGGLHQSFASKIDLLCIPILTFALPQIKLKRERSKGDKEEEAKRQQLLEFLNSTYE